MGREGVLDQQWTLSFQNTFSAYFLCLSLENISVHLPGIPSTSPLTLWSEQIAQQEAKMGLPIVQHLKNKIIISLSLTLCIFQVLAVGGKIWSLLFYHGWVQNFTIFYAGQNSERREQWRKRILEICTEVPSSLS